MSKMTLLAVLAGVTLSASVCQAQTIKVGPNGKSNIDGTTTIKITLPPGTVIDNTSVEVTIDGTTYSGDKIGDIKNGNEPNTKTIDVKDPNAFGNCDVTVEVKTNNGTRIKSAKTKVKVRASGMLEDECDEEFNDDSQS